MWISFGNNIRFSNWAFNLTFWFGFGHLFSLFMSNFLDGGFLCCFYNLFSRFNILTVSFMSNSSDSHGFCLGFVDISIDFLGGMIRNFSFNFGMMGLSNFSLGVNLILLSFGNISWGFRFECSSLRFFSSLFSYVGFFNCNMSFLSISMSSGMNFNSNLFSFFDNLFSFVSFNNLFFSFSMNLNVFGFLVISIGFSFGVISLSFSNMCGGLLEISLHFNGMSFNGGSGSFMSTGVGFFLSVFSVSFSFSGNMNLFLGGLLDLVSSVRFGSFFLGDLSLGFLVISSSNLFSSVD
jgi:hypothetical protein